MMRPIIGGNKIKLLFFIEELYKADLINGNDLKDIELTIYLAKTIIEKSFQAPQEGKNTIGFIAEVVAQKALKEAFLALGMDTSILHYNSVFNRQSPQYLPNDKGADIFSEGNEFATEVKDRKCGYMTEKGIEDGVVSKLLKYILKLWILFSGYEKEQREELYRLANKYEITLIIIPEPVPYKVVDGLYYFDIDEIVEYIEKWTPVLKGKIEYYLRRNKGTLIQYGLLQAKTRDNRQDTGKELDDKDDRLVDDHGMVSKYFIVNNPSNRIVGTVVKLIDRFRVKHSIYGYNGKHVYSNGHVKRKGLSHLRSHLKPLFVFTIDSKLGNLLLKKEQRYLSTEVRNKFFIYGKDSNLLNRKSKRWNITVHKSSNYTISNN